MSFESSEAGGKGTRYLNYTVSVADETSSDSGSDDFSEFGEYAGLRTRHWPWRKGLSESSIMIDTIKAAPLILIWRTVRQNNTK